MVHRAIELDGTCSGEHGVGLGKVEYLESELGVGTVGLMETIKRTGELIYMYIRSGSESWGEFTVMNVRRWWESQDLIRRIREIRGDEVRTRRSYSYSSGLRTWTGVPGMFSDWRNWGSRCYRCSSVRGRSNCRLWRALMTPWSTERSKLTIQSIHWT